ncbi:low molecular weight protein-tyrosine-phosphatase [Sphingorhabdus arenilitoris]|uniref:protein-tyrosine-phosphatase n=1 Tax=Sphingorhabdus arenilitoris TaxID=1490041 RepID=A0ABV8RHR3_9SPHN
MTVIRPIQSVLFVCLGNICRSPLAEAAMRQAAKQKDLTLKIDSAGTGDWHIGHAPDRRARAAALQYGGIDISAYKARQVRQSDFVEFDLICALDSNNLTDLQAMSGTGTAQLSLLLDHLPGWQGQSVADPYYGDEDDFASCWHQVQAATESLAHMLAKNG